MQEGMHPKFNSLKKHFSLKKLTAKILNTSLCWHLIRLRSKLIMPQRTTPPSPNQTTTTTHPLIKVDTSDKPAREIVKAVVLRNVQWHATSVKMSMADTPKSARTTRATVQTTKAIITTPNLALSAITGVVPTMGKKNYSRQKMCWRERDNEIVLPSIGTGI